MLHTEVVISWDFFMKIYSGKQSFPSSKVHQCMIPSFSDLSSSMVINIFSRQFSWFIIQRLNWTMGQNMAKYKGVKETEEKKY